MSTINLKSSDNVIFVTDVKTLKCSGTIQNMLEVCDMTDEKNSIVPLPIVRSEILSLVLKWAKYHSDDPQPVADDKRSWDEEFLKVEQSTLFELITAANYLDIKGLSDITCKKVANMMKGKTTGEIRALFNIENDNEPDEEEID